MIFEKSRYTDSDLYYNVKDDITYLDSRIDFDFDESSAIYYQFQAGDRLDVLAEKFLKDSRLYWAILKANPNIYSEMDIKAGDIIVIPVGVNVYE